MYIVLVLVLVFVNLVSCDYVMEKCHFEYAPINVKVQYVSKIFPAQQTYIFEGKSYQYPLWGFYTDFGDDYPDEIEECYQKVTYVLLVDGRYAVFPGAVGFVNSTTPYVIIDKVPFKYQYAPEPYKRRVPPKTTLGNSKCMREKLHGHVWQLKSIRYLKYQSERYMKIIKFLDGTDDPWMCIGLFGGGKDHVLEIDEENHVHFHEESSMPFYLKPFSFVLEFFGNIKIKIFNVFSFFEQIFIKYYKLFICIYYENYITTIILLLIILMYFRDIITALFVFGVVMHVSLYFDIFYCTYY